MARRKSKKTSSQNNFCTFKHPTPRVFSSTVTHERARLIISSQYKWVNGTVLHYYFYNAPSQWSINEEGKQMVRDAFDVWKDVGIGLNFKEVDSASEAEIRVAFEEDDGHWSYIGRYMLRYSSSEKTMNLDPSTNNFDIDTAVHEIGHSLGFMHAHQNPKAGIVWNKPAVYAELAKPPNEWTKEETDRNILDKLDSAHYPGSKWDPDSIMHYPFEAGLIDEPENYRNGLIPAPGLSARDEEWVKKFYPPLTARDYQKLKVLESVKLNLKDTEQINFLVEPEATRKYTIGTFGKSDCVLVLFEMINGEQRYLTADDDSGEDKNAEISIKLFAGKKYSLSLRLYYLRDKNDFSVMIW